MRLSRYLFVLIFLRLASRSMARRMVSDSLRRSNSASFRNAARHSGETRIVSRSSFFTPIECPTKPLLQAKLCSYNVRLC